MSAFVVFHEMSFPQLTPEEIAELQSKVDNLESINVAFLIKSSNSLMRITL